LYSAECDGLKANALRDKTRFVLRELKKAATSSHSDGDQPTRELADGFQTSDEERRMRDLDNVSLSVNRRRNATGIRIPIVSDAGRICFSKRL
jgi:hypothetical protein